MGLWEQAMQKASTLLGLVAAVLGIVAAILAIVVSIGQLV